MRRWCQLGVLLAAGLLIAGCPKGKEDYKQGRQAVDLQDYDAAVEYYLKATKADPHNVNYKIGLDQARFEAGQNHVRQGLQLRDKGDLQGAVAQFQRAQILDPSSTAADQELKKTLQMIAERAKANEVSSEPLIENGEPALASAPPELKPLSRAPINLRMSNDVKVVFDTIGKLAGLTVIYDPDLQARRIPVDLNNVTLEQALDITCLEAKAFWKPITENIIMIVPDNNQKRRDYEEQEVRTFYLSNVSIPQDLTEITTGLRQLLDLKRIHQVNAQNAIIIRDTPDKIALAEKIIRDIDKAKPEVVIQMEVLQARTDRLHNLGILPGQSASIAINPNATTNSSSSTSTTTGNSPGTVTLNQLTHLTQNDVVLTLPGATANFLMTDSATKIIDNPEIRAIDGQPAKLRVGDRVPVATGSFQAGVGVGSTAGAGFVNPLVNTQFQYIDVGVNVDITPHVHPNRDISLKVSVEVSSVTGQATIGGIQQPIISQRKIEHEIRLKEGEVSILGGLFERVDSKTLNGWPGLANVPIMRYLFSTDNVEHQENENLIVLIPRIVRMPDWTPENLRALYSGTETNVGVRREMDVKAPVSNPNPTLPAATPAPGAPNPGGVPAVAPAGQPPPATPQAQVSGPHIVFEPSTLNLSPGQTATIGVVVQNVTDLFSVPMLLQYNPAIISVEEVRHGGFLTGGSQEIALVQRVDKEHGQAIISATRQPNTPGVNGTGTLLGVVVKALAPGTTNLSIVQINAKDSQQKPIPFVTGEATLNVR
ncbi:MAG TPA: type II and III secretion system protein [Candidatus Eisenbacteria bacterium]|nr:type II and III secretion system protein [Candidatus Eisenbacteria bacterium]